MTEPDPVPEDLIERLTEELDDMLDPRGPWTKGDF